MDKIKEVTGTVQTTNGKFFSVLGSDRNMYIVEFDKKHLSRFKELKLEPGQLITLSVKTTSMANEVVNVVSSQKQEESNVVEFEMKRACVG